MSDYEPDYELDIYYAMVDNESYRRAPVAVKEEAMRRIKRGDLNGGNTDFVFRGNGKGDPERKKKDDSKGD